MKIAVICANGKEGQLIVKEAVDRQMDVTAIARGRNKSVAEHFLCRDLFDLTSGDLADFDVVIDAFGAWEEHTLPQHVTSLRHLCNLVSGSSTRLLVVGGAGSLYVNQEHTICVMDGADFPDSFKAVAFITGKALDELRTRTDVNWTYISPACDFQAERPKTGHYIWGGEELLLNQKGESVIGYADFACAMIDEAANGTHNQKRLSVVEA